MIKSEAQALLEIMTIQAAEAPSEVSALEFVLAFLAVIGRTGRSRMSSFEERAGVA